jgi:hypothetical protein
MNAIKNLVNSIPKPVRDFVEGGAAVMVTGAADQILALNLGVATPKLILAAALVGALNAGISYARRKGLQPVATTPS